MGFGLGDLASIGAGGGLGWLAYKAINGAGNTDVAQIPLMDQAQTDARGSLSEFIKTGKLGGYEAGKAYTGSLGDFALSELEKQGLARVNANATAGNGVLFDSGSQVLQDLLNTDKYNPLNQTGMISGLTDAIDYNTREAATAAKRNSAYAGNLYSTDAVRQLGNVEAQGANTKATTLASLYQNYINTKLGAAPQAIAAQAQQNAEGRQRTADLFTAGALPRSLNNAKDQAAYAEFQRQQAEKQGQVTAATNLAGSNVPYGVPNVSIPNANPWMDVLSLLAQFGGKVAGGKLAAA